jgi:hypothetical protein
MFATTNADRFVAWLTRQLLPRLRPSVLTAWFAE